MRCRGLHKLANPHIQADSFALPCPVLHRIAFPVVSEWCQYRPPVHLRPAAPFSMLLMSPLHRHPPLRPGAAPGPESTRRTPPSISVLSLMERKTSRVA